MRGLGKESLSYVPICSQIGIGRLANIVTIPLTNAMKNKHP